MTMKAYAQKIAAVLMFVCLLNPATMAFSEEAKWLFNSIYGRPLQISYDPEEGLYSFISGDVTQRVPPCEIERMRICLRSDGLDMSIPEKMQEVGESWTDGRTTFSLVTVIRKLELLDKHFENILVITATKDLQIALGIPGTRKSTLFYSYQNGLIAFQVESDQGGGSIYIASQLPSLGADQN